MLFIELEQQAVLVECTLKALSDKVPKVVLAALEVLLRAVSAFGAKIVDPKPIFKSLPAVFTHSNAAVRDKAKDLTVELASWVGTPVVQSVLLDKMSDAMRKDVETSLAAQTTPPPGRKKAERLTRKDAAAAGGGGGADEDEDNDAVPMDIDSGAAGTAAATDFGDGDPYDFSDPVDILGGLSKSIVIVGDDSTPFWDCFTSKKWNVRKGALDKVKEAARRAPKLALGDYNPICSEVKKVLAKDANITCATSAAEVVGALAQGLRRDFGGQARQLCPAVLERFKEKNTIMSKAADDALRTMAKHCYALTDVADDLAAAMSHKNPKGNTF